MKKNEEKIGKIMKAVAMGSAKRSVNSTCSWIFYQSKVPDSVKKLRKF